jgi:hypothetical protein
MGLGHEPRNTRSVNTKKSRNLSCALCTNGKFSHAAVEGLRDAAGLARRLRGVGEAY